MTYQSILDARKSAEANQGNVREAVRMGLQMKKEMEARKAAAPVSVGHSDDAAVDRFSAAMKAKLAKKRAEGRGGWENKDQCSAEFLSALLREHVEKGDPVDVANLAMMLHQRGETIRVGIHCGYPHCDCAPDVVCGPVAKTHPDFIAPLSRPAEDGERQGDEG